MIHENFRCEFYFIRHGESTANVTPGYAGGIDFDSSLTDTGRDQARRLGERLRCEKVRFDRVYSSSLVRTAQTAEIMLEAMGEPGRPFERVDALIEQQMPGWRGVKIEEAYTPQMREYMPIKGAHFVPPDGESHRMVQRRTSGWLEEEIIYNGDLVSTEQSLTVAVVGHGAASRCLFQYIMGYDDRFVTRCALNNCSISRFVFDREAWSVVCINDSYHLNGAGWQPSFEARP